MIINQITVGSGGSAPAHYIEKTVDANGKLINGGTSVIDMTGVTDVGEYALAYAYRAATFPANTSVNFSSLTTISGTYACNYAFQTCTGITSVDLSSLTTVSATNGCYSMFDSCSGITSINLDALTTVSGSKACYQMFYQCSGITSINLSKLTAITGNQGCYGMFYGCAGITSADLSSLTTVGGQACVNMFRTCTSLTSLSFPSLTSASFGGSTNQFTNLLNGVIGCTVHFPSNIQSVIGSWADVTNGFGGTNTTVLFDLPATNTLTGADTKTYSRNPKYDTATALAWKVGAYGTTDFTPFYTSGTTGPSVGDTIYSDAACTTSVTTIDSIA